MTPPRAPVPLADVRDAGLFGGKAVQLGAAIRAGLPVPPGVALPWPLVDAVAAGRAEALAALATASSLGGFLAARSSGVGEDSVRASFAGQHESALNVPASALADAVGAVWRSARGDPALAYRRRVAVSGALRIAAVVQRMVPADVAGVAFRPNPATGADEIVIEAAWGLGEAVVAGRVIPDHFRLDPRGALLECRPGLKDVMVVARAGGGTAEHVVPMEQATTVCLQARELALLWELTRSCGRVFAGSQDLEWAIARGRLWLLQRRAVTTGGASTAGRE